MTCGSCTNGCNSCTTTETNTCNTCNTGCTSCTKTTACCDSCAVTQTTIDPLVVNPVTATDAADNKYSVETTVKKTLGGGSQNNVYAGQFSGATTADLVDNALDKLVEIMGDIIRANVVSTYVDNIAAFDSTTTLADEATFKTFFLTDGGSTHYPITTQAGVKIDFIAGNFYTLFRRVKDHIESAEESLAVCAGSAPRLLNSKIDTCLFCFELRYN